MESRRTVLKYIAGTLKHFHFYSAQGSVAKCGFSWGKAAPALGALYTPEVKML